MDLSYLNVNVCELCLKRMSDICGPRCDLVQVFFQLLNYFMRSLPGSQISLIYHITPCNSVIENMFSYLQDQMLRKPNGLAWVLFTDTASVQRAVEYYNSGQAVMYGTPYVISTVNVDITADAGAEKNAKTKARSVILKFF